MILEGVAVGETLGEYVVRVGFPVVGAFVGDIVWCVGDTVEGDRVESVGAVEGDSDHPASVCIFCVCVYVCVYVCVCVYMCVYVCICVYMCVYVCICVYTCVYVCACCSLSCVLCGYMCVFVCVCVHVCICVYMRVYVCKCVHMCAYVCICVYMLLAFM